MVTKKQQELLIAQTEFILAIKRAKAKGVNVAAIFLEVREQVMLAWVRCFGLMMGILFVSTAPFLPPAFRVLCYKIGMPYELSEVYYYWPFVVGIFAILAFGFNLVDPRTLKRITGKPTMAQDEQRMSESGHFITRITDEADGDV